MLTADRLLGCVVLLKAVDVGQRGPQALPGPGWAAALALWVLAGVVLLTGRSARSAWVAVVVAGVALAADYPLELRRQHLVLLIGLALGAAVAHHAGERLLLWRIQLTALYGVAAMAKLNESFLGGDVLAVTFLTGPLGVLPPPLVLLIAGLGLIAAEAALAVLLWRPARRRISVVLAVGLHSAALVVASASHLVGLRLVVFGAAAVIACAACADLLPGASDR